MRLLSLALFFWLIAPTLSEAAEVGPGDDLRAAIAALGPGDELVLSGGTYEFNSRFNISVVGESGRPAIIRAKSGETPVIHMTTGSQNVIEIQGSRHLIVRGLTFTGGSHGIRLMGSDYVTIEDCEIYETGDVAISANSGGTYEGLVIRRNHIHHTNGTGEGMYLGCDNDRCRVLNSVIEWNYIHHTNRTSVIQGDGIELKEGSAGNIVRHNVIHDTNYPGILTYSTRGNGGPNVIEGNVVWSSNDYAIQSAADSIIRNNIIIGGEIALQSHQAGSPSNQEIVHNTIINDSGGLYVRDVSGPVLIANNAVYSQSGAAIRLISGDLSQVTVIGNVGAGGLSGGSEGYASGNGIAVDFVDAGYRNAPPIDLFPPQGSALIGAGAAEYTPANDFNGTPRAGSADAGAYQHAPGGNPGWALSAGFKGAISKIRPKPPTDVTAE